VSFFDDLVDVVAAPVKIATRVATGTVKATAKLVTLEPEAALREVEKTAAKSEKIALKAIDKVIGQ
jgi:hypothetical protein